MGITVNDKIGRWMVIKQVSIGRRGRWLCQCECGIFRTVRGDALKSDTSHSCGCLNAENTTKRQRTHGSPKEFRIWLSMRQRCNNPNASNYRLYGAKGITICPEWSNFINFFANMGPRPTPKHSIERRNGKGNYEPDNCYWATPTQQIRNRSTTVYATIDNVTLPAAEWYERYPLLVSYKTFTSRLKMGWAPHRALTTPLLR